MYCFTPAQRLCALFVSVTLVVFSVPISVFAYAEESNETALAADSAEEEYVATLDDEGAVQDNSTIAEPVATVDDELVVDESQDLEVEADSLEIMVNETETGGDIEVQADDNTTTATISDVALTTSGKEAIQTSASKKAGVSVRAHVQNYGWRKAVGNGKTAGTMGKSLRLEAYRIKLVRTGVSGGIEYRSRVQKKGWMAWKRDGAMSGTKGKSLRIEAIQMRLTGDVAEVYDLYYRVYVQNIGWLAWAQADATAGSKSLGLRVEAMQVQLLPKGSAVPSNEDASCKKSFVSSLSVSYKTYVQGKGWQSLRRNGKTSGTKGKKRRIEGLSVGLKGGLPGGVKYRTYMQGSGWQSWNKNGSEAGLPGQGKRVEAFSVKLTGLASRLYNVWYRAYVQDVGWMGWTSNGAYAGTSGMSRRVEAVQIRVVRKGSKSPGSMQNAYMNGSLRAGLDAASGDRAVKGFGGYSPSSKIVNRISSAIDGIRGSGYDVGFIMMDLTKMRGVSYNCDGVFYGASSIKAPYIASVVSAHPEALEVYSHNIQETLTYSWDYDYKQVYYGYGKDPMRTWCKESGARSSIAESLPWADYSARDLAKLWARNYQLFQSSSAGETFGSWCEHPETSTIHSTLGGRYRTRSKAGWIVDPEPRYNVSDDGGIVYASNGAYVIAIMSSIPANQDMLNQLTAAIDAAHAAM